MRIYFIVFSILIALSTCAQSSLLVQIPLINFNASMPIYFEQGTAIEILNKREINILSAEFKYKNKFALGFNYLATRFNYYGSNAKAFFKENGVLNATKPSSYLSTPSEVTFLNRYEIYLCKITKATKVSLDYGIGLKFGENQGLMATDFYRSTDNRIYKSTNALNYNAISFNVKANLTYFSKKRLGYRFYTSLENFQITEEQITINRYSGLVKQQYIKYGSGRLIGFATFGAGMYFQLIGSKIDE